MSKTKDTAELRRIKKWYDRIMQGPRPTKAELKIQFRGYTDQAELLIRRIDDGQPWEDFILGIDGLPPAYLDALQIITSAFVHKQPQVLMVRGRKL